MIGKDLELSKKDSQQWDLILTPKSSLFSLPFTEIWRYRDLIWLFVKRDFAAQYKQTILGPFWHIIQPALTTAMFLLIFNRIAQIPTDGINPILFYMSGITIWNYFSHCLTQTSNTFVANAGIFGKVYFPRMVLPLSVSISNLIRFAIQFLLLLVTMIWMHFHGYPLQISARWLLIPVILLPIAGIALGMGIIISSITTKYRDFIVLLNFMIQLAMYATPIVYPYSYLKDKNYEWIIALNPLTSLVESFRFILFSRGTVELNLLLYSIAFSIITLGLGFLIFHKVEKDFMDTV